VTESSPRTAPDGPAPRIASLDLLRRVDEALAVECAAFGRPAEPLRREAYLRHAAYPRFAALGATVGERLVGFGYGHLDEAGQWWHDQIAAAMSAAGHAAWLDGSWVLVELHVHPDWQRRGLGHALLTRLVADRPEPAVLLSTGDAATPARALYRRLGFVDLLTGFRFGGEARPFAVMGARLPLRQGR
jgi:ribosomal protein S18 acetylase RimI-like enzyme